MAAGQLSPQGGSPRRSAGVRGRSSREGPLNGIRPICDLGCVDADLSMPSTMPSTPPPSTTLGGIDATKGTQLMRPSTSQRRSAFGRSGWVPLRFCHMGTRARCYFVRLLQYTPNPSTYSPLYPCACQWRADLTGGGSAGAAIINCVAPGRPHGTLSGRLHEYYCHTVMSLCRCNGCNVY